MSRQLFAVPLILTAAVVGAVAIAGQPAAADIITIGNNPVTVPFLSAIFGNITRSSVPWSFDGGMKFSFYQRAALFNYQFSETLSLRALRGNGFLAGPLKQAHASGLAALLLQNQRCRTFSEKAVPLARAAALGEGGADHSPAIWASSSPAARGCTMVGPI